MSDLEKINTGLSLEELATYKPKQVLSRDRENLVAMTKAQWIEIVQWIQMRMPETKKWEDINIEVWFRDLQEYAYEDVFVAVESLYKEGRTSFQGSHIVSRLNDMAVDPVRNIRKEQSMAGADFCQSCEQPSEFMWRYWISDKNGNPIFVGRCDTDGCDNEVKRIPTEADLELKPASVTKADMLKGMYVVKNLNLDMRKKIWAQFKDYPDGNLMEAVGDVIPDFMTDYEVNDTK